MNAITWKLYHTKEGYWVAVCDQLSLTLQSTRQKELHFEIWESMNTLLLDLMKNNKYEEFMKNHGFIGDLYDVQRWPVQIIFSPAGSYI